MSEVQDVSYLFSYIYTLWMQYYFTAAPSRIKVQVVTCNSLKYVEIVEAVDYNILRILYWASQGFSTSDAVFPFVERPSYGQYTRLIYDYWVEKAAAFRYRDSQRHLCSTTKLLKHKVNSRQAATALSVQKYRAVDTGLVRAVNWHWL